VTDRELIEMAAKAAGVEGEWEDHPQINGRDASGIYIEGHTFLWNPLASNDDALKLLVTCGVDLDCGPDYISAYVWDFAENRSIVKDITEQFGGDKLAAYRRAITRAAAAIGGAR